MRELLEKSGRPRLRLAATVVLVLSTLAPVLFGQERDSSGDPAAPSARLDEMRQLVGPFRLTMLGDGPRARVELRREPIARWNDPTRDFSDGSLWLWTRDTVPIAAVAVELYPDRTKGANWAYEFVSLTTDRFELSGGEGFARSDADLSPPRSDATLSWAPGSPGVEFRDVSDAPAPGRTESERLRQAKALAKRFSANETYHKQTYTLRLLPHPVHRFAEESSGLLDGAVFLLTNGTNPEIVLLMEARRRSNGSVAWRYAAAPLSHAALSLSLDRKVVWTFPGSVLAERRATYFTARKLREPEFGELRSPRGGQP